jgi:hypothetical protein
VAVYSPSQPFKTDVEEISAWTQLGAEPKFLGHSEFPLTLESIFVTNFVSDTCAAVLKFLSHRVLVISRDNYLDQMPKPEDISIGKDSFRLPPDQ